MSSHTAGASMAESGGVFWVLNYNTEEDRTLISNIKLLWQQCKNNQFLTMRLEELFSYPGCNPYLKCLFVMFHSGDLKSIRPGSLCFSVLQIFKNWRKKNNVEAWLTENVQDLAFEVALLMGNSSLISTHAEVFKLDSCGKRYLPRLRELLTPENYKLVAQWSVIMKLCDEFTIAELVVPAYTQDRMQLAEIIIDSAPSLLVPFFDFLDKLLARGRTPRAIIEDYYVENGLEDAIGSISEKVCLNSAVVKYIKRLLDKYPDVASKITLDNYKSLNNRKRMGFLIHRRFQENSISNETLHEFLTSLMEGESDELREDLVYKLVEYGDMASALYWANTMNKPFSSNLQSLVDTISQEVAEGKSYVSEPTEESWDDEEFSTQNTYSLSIPESAIILVDTPEKFWDVIDEVKQNCVIGIDSEWSPFQLDQYLSLVQLAVPGKVFILDAIVLQSCIVQWNTLVQEVICNPTIVKVGFSLSGDFKNWCLYLGTPIKPQGIFDLMALSALISSGNITVQLPYASEEDKHKNSLSQMVFNCFGKQLRKTEQFSEWNSRPLTQTKLHYAALDAYVLIEIYQSLEEIFSNSGVFFEDIIGMVADNFEKPVKKNQKKKKKKKKPAENVGPSNDVPVIPIFSQEVSYEPSHFLEFDDELDDLFQYQLDPLDGCD